MMRFALLLIILYQTDSVFCFHQTLSLSSSSLAVCILNDRLWTLSLREATIQD